MNNTDSGLFTVFTGVQNFSRIHLVDKWNGLSKVSRSGDSPQPLKQGLGWGQALGDGKCSGEGVGVT